MLKGFTHAHLACGCRLAFRDGVEGSPVTVVVDLKSPGCPLTLHVSGLPLYDYREALRPPTRPGPSSEHAYADAVSDTQLRQSVHDLVALGPRMGGTPSGDKAAAYLEQYFKRL